MRGCRVRWRCWAGLTIAWALALVGCPGPSVSAQSVGAGASPGRAAYRPAGQWNDGPFYSVPHWDAYAPRRGIDTGLPYSEANAPPYTSEPRGTNVAYDPARGPLHSYAQGFSPFSGYASWYQQANHFTPTGRDLSAATTQYFRSSPIPADPRYLAPEVSRAYYAPPAAPTVISARPATRQAAANPAAPRVETPGTPARNAPAARGPVIYRFLP